MDHKPLKIPDVYLYGLPTIDNKAFTVDIGCEAIADISVNNNNEPEVMARKSIPVNNGAYTKFKIYKPCLPLEPPNFSISYNSNDFVQRSLGRRSNIKTCTNVMEHYINFRERNNNVLYKSLINMQKKENVYPLQSYFDTVANMEKAVKFNKYRRYYRMNKDQSFMRTSTVSDIVSDIPNNVLMQYIDESLFIEYDEYQYNYKLKNCILNLTINERTFVICSFGPNRSDLFVKEIFYEDEKDYGIGLLHTVKNKAYHQLGFQVREIKHIIDNMILVRGDYDILLCNINVMESSIKIEILTEYSFEKYVACACVNPLNLEEIVAITEDRSIMMLHSNSTERLITHGLFTEKVDWQSCIYGNYQQTCLVSTEKNVNLYDFRASQLKVSEYIELPCQYLNRIEKISPVLMWSPWNHHQYIITSNQSLILNDERYTKTPILKVNHYMTSSPRFAQMVQLNSDSTLLSVGSYREGEIICFQLCQDGFIEGNKTLQQKPVTVKQPLWKLSRYNDWLSYSDDWKQFSSEVEQRLQQPLIGFCIHTIQHEKDKVYYGIVQQSLPGDLFSQVFCHETISSNINKNKLHNDDFVSTEFLADTEYNKPLTLSEPFEKSCETWLSNTFDMHLCSCNDDNIYSNLLKKHQDLCGTMDNVTLTAFNGIDNNSSVNNKSPNKTSQYIKLNTEGLSKRVIDNFKLDDCFANCTEGNTECKAKEKHKDNNENRELGKNDLECSIDVDNEDKEIKSSSQQCNINIDENNCRMGSISEEEVINNECFCSSCGTKLIVKIENLKKNNSILCNNLLARQRDEKLLNLIEDPSKFVNPLSKVLLTNWHADKYTPLDVFALNVAYDSSLNT